MNEADLSAHGFEHGDLVDIETIASGRRLRLEKITAIAHDIARTIRKRTFWYRSTILTRIAARLLINLFLFVWFAQRLVSFVRVHCLPATHDASLAAGYVS
jgi:hypothetical protein